MPNADSSPTVHDTQADTFLAYLTVERGLAANTIEACYWHEASVLHNLRFLELPEQLVSQLCADLGVGAYAGSIPFRLVRGVLKDVLTHSHPKLLSVGILGTLYAAMGGFTSMIEYPRASSSRPFG